MTLVDSNIFIYAAAPQGGAIRAWIGSQPCAASVVAFAEVFSYPRLTAEDHSDLRDLMATIALLDVTRLVADAAAELRRQRQIRLGDALIAATALTHKLPLATHNTKDFRWIQGLELLDPASAA